MDKNYTIAIDHDNKFIRLKHQNQIKAENIGEAWDELLMLEEFTVGKYNLFSDYRKGIFIGSTVDVYEICDILRPLKGILQDKKQAMLLDSPMNTALSILFKKEVYNQIGFIINIFSTEEAAYSWITSD